ncbi:MAG: IS3 family transposase [Candidatus Omnitrophica bacterium]|nr:IS3 family transposase [Candidatus Omnitrophota bacterium]
MATRKSFSNEFKSKVAMEALRGEMTMAQISSKYGVHSNQVQAWKKVLKEGMGDLFTGSKKKSVKQQKEMIEDLYKNVGKLQVENDWLKKKLGFAGAKERLSLISEADKNLSIRNQCELMGITRSRYYYKQTPEQDKTFEIMNLLDEEHTKRPFYGVRKMTEFLNREGYKIGTDKVRTLLRRMGLEAICPKRNLSRKRKDHKVYPYLLRGVKMVRPNQVWSTDITYVRLLEGFAYLVAIIDWFSRYVISWSISNTADVDLCMEALESSLKYGKPEIFNTDQGCQFTSDKFTGRLKDKKIKISMDGRGMMFDNIFVERLWRTVKYEDIYIRGYETIPESRKGLKKYFEFYNNERYHQSLNYKTPWEFYSGIANMELSTC